MLGEEEEPLEVDSLLPRSTPTTLVEEQGDRVRIRWASTAELMLKDRDADRDRRRPVGSAAAAAEAKPSVSLNVVDVVSGSDDPWVEVASS